jgi:hypothetical protein
MAVSEVCAISEALCSVSDGPYAEPGNCSISAEEIRRCALAMGVSHGRKRERRTSYTRLS